MHRPSRGLTHDMGQMTMFANKLRWTALALPLVALGMGACTSGTADAVESGRVIEVRMLDDGGKTRYEPANVEVRPGDVVRFVQGGSMPHNVQFARNSAPAGVDLGDLWTGPYLSAAGESYEIQIDERFADGEYSFLCTPHAAMGMTGTLTVSGAGNGSAAPAARADLPEITGVQGLQPLEYEMDGEVKVFRLTAERIRWETKEGNLVDAMAYNRMIPGPQIRVTEGDRVRIIVTNRLDQPHTTHWHGLFVPNAMDGVPGITQDPILPGDSFTYEFTAAPHGTRLYHSHFNALTQEGAGLYGAFVIEEKNPPAIRQSDREEFMILGDGTLGFVINGKEFPMTEPIKMKQGERVRVRMANLGGMYHPMHMHGGFMTVIAKDGFPVPSPQKVNTISIAPGETWDVILHPQFPGTWIWHCHVLAHATGPKDADGNETAAGMIGAIVVEGDDVPAVDLKNHKNH